MYARMLKLNGQPRPNKIRPIVTKFNYFQDKETIKKSGNREIEKFQVKRSRPISSGNPAEVSKVGLRP